MNFDKLSRRNFIKKSVAVTTGVAALTLFSGLVHAGEEYKCEIVRKSTTIDIPDGPKIPIYECQGGDPSCNKSVECGRMYLFNAQTGAPIPDNQGNVQWFDVAVDCANDRGEKGVFCYRDVGVVV